MHQRGGAADRPHDVGVCQYSRLGRPRCAARVDEGCRLLGGDTRRSLVSEPRLSLQPIDAHPTELREPLQVRVIAALAIVEHHDPVQFGQRRSHFEDLGQQVVIFDKAQAGPAVIEDVPHLLGGAGGVDRHRHATVGERTHVGEVPLHAIVRKDGDPLAGPYAEIHQAGGDFGDRLSIIGPREGLPPDSRAAAHRRSIRELAHGGAKGLDDGRALDHDCRCILHGSLLRLRSGVDRPGPAIWRSGASAPTTGHPRCRSAPRPGSSPNPPNPDCEVFRARLPPSARARRSRPSPPWGSNDPS